MKNTCPTLRLKTLQHHLLVFLLCGFVLGYHAASHFWGAHWLEEWGYAARYRLGQVSGIAAAGKEKDKTMLYLRNEARFFNRSSEFFATHKITENLKYPIKRIKATGADFILLTIPTKSSIYPHSVPAYYKNEAWGWLNDPNKTDLYQELREAFPGDVVDVNLLFRDSMKRFPNRKVISELDYHWNSWGETVVVEAVIRLLQRRGEIFSEPMIAQVGVAPLLHRFLLNSFRLTPGFAKTNPELELTENKFRVESQALKTKYRRLIQLGTSFTCSYEELNFFEQLKRITGLPGINFAVSGGGYSEAYIRYLASGVKLGPGDLVIWEMPFCCLNTISEANIFSLPRQNILE